MAACTFGIRPFAEFSRIPSARSSALRRLYVLRLRRGPPLSLPAALLSPAGIIRYVIDGSILPDGGLGCKRFLMISLNIFVNSSTIPPKMAILPNFFMKFPFYVFNLPEAP